VRILHIDSEGGWRGGQQQVWWLVDGLRHRGHEQLVVGPGDSELLRRADTQGLALTANYGDAKAWSFRAAGRVRDLIRTFRPDIVHAHAANAHRIGLKAARGLVPLVTTRRVDFAIKRNPISRAKYRADGQWFIAISDAVARELERVGVARERILMVPSGVDTARATSGDRSRLRAEFLAGGTGPVIGFIGALVDHKAPLTLAKAWPAIAKELPDAQVLFIGDGPLAGEMMAWKDAQHARGVHLLGWRDDVPDCLAALDLFVMCSKEEGLCTSLLDAQAAGVPCVITAAGGMVTIVRDGENGIVVPIGDSAALAEAVVRLWRDEALRARFAEAGRRTVAARFTREAMVSGNEAAYMKITAAWRG
jgi:glycosyltransferase involved in cell wall biosynthesis